MKKQTLGNFVALSIWLAPIIYFIKIYSSLPQTVPLHFGLDGNADKFGNKQELLQLILILSFVSMGIYFLLKYLPRIDPKKAAKYSSDTFKKISIVLLIFMSLIEFSIICSASVKILSLNIFFLRLMGLFFAVLGNLMNNIKPNYFVGIRTPWTLEDENTWRATHQLAGKMWFWGGIITVILSLLLPYKIVLYSFISITTIICLIPISYSYFFFKKHHKQAV